MWTLIEYVSNDNIHIIVNVLYTKNGIDKNKRLEIHKYLCLRVIRGWNLLGVGPLTINQSVVMLRRNRFYKFYRKNVSLTL